MKLKIYVHSAETVEADSKLLKAVTHFINKMFRNVDSSLRTIASWGRDNTNTKDSNDTDDSEAQSTYEQPQDISKRHVLFEVLPGDADDWNTNQLYRLLVKNVDETDSQLIFNFYMKANGADNSDNVDKLGVKFNKQAPDESDSSYDERLQRMLETVGQQLISKITDGEIDTIADLRMVQPK
jgi:hypothetical protein